MAPPDPTPQYTAAAVHQPLHQGHQPLAGLWWPADWFDADERARRLVAAWQRGAAAWRFAEGDLLRYAAPVERDCEGLPGWPLVQQGGRLTSAPVTPDEARRLPAADVWIVRGGQVLALDLAQGGSLDPSAWLAVDGLALHDTFDCRDALPPPQVLAPAEARALREVLGGKVPPASEEQVHFLKALAERQGRGRPAVRHLPGGSGGHEGQGGGKTLAAALVVMGVGLLLAVLFASPPDPATHRGPGLGWLWLLLIGALVVTLARKAGRDTDAGATWRVDLQQPAAPPPAPPDVPARRDGSVRPQAWRRWLARLAMTTEISRLLGRRQAAYLRRMLELFESGRLDEALRHAIPLGGRESLGQAFGTPTARQDLSLTRTPGASISLHVGDELDQYLRQLYRRSFEKLDREGRIDEAVYVLAELLDSRQEALDYLERKERFAQAAELALAWDQPTDVIVRLHVLAGDWRRAVAVARRDNAFAGAVAQLEKRWPDAAHRLRQAWAESLALRGDWLAAVDVLWPVAAARPQAAAWLDRAGEAEGALAGRALVRRALLLPDTLAAQGEVLESLRDDPMQHARRTALVRELLAAPQRSAALDALARLVTPAVLADQSRPGAELSREDLQRLVDWPGNGWLAADLTGIGLPGPTASELSRHQEVIVSQPPAPGQLPLLDAIVLDGGRHLLALGEAGVALVDAQGRVVLRFPVPATRLVASPQGQVALALTPRDQVWRVSRLDLLHRRCEDLGAMPLCFVAPEFDGLAWTIAEGTRLAVLDTQRGLGEVLWQVTDLPGTVRHLSANTRVEQLVLQGPRGDAEVWRYQLPQRRLLARGEAWPATEGSSSLQLLSPNGGVLEVQSRQTGTGGLAVSVTSHGRERTLDWTHPHAGDVTHIEAHAGGAWLLVGVTDAVTVHWLCSHLDTGRLHAQLEWPAADRPRVRLALDRQVSLFDRTGRLWHLDTRTSQVQALSVR
jgi:hypothetical protein